MQKIKVAKKEPSAGQGKPTALFDEQGTRFSGFDTKLLEVNIGDTIEADIDITSKSGKTYCNIKSFRILEKGNVAVTEANGNERNRSIERQVAVKVASSMHVPGTVTVEKLLEDAEKIVRWISGEVQVKAEPASKKESQVQNKELTLNYLIEAAEGSPYKTEEIQAHMVKRFGKEHSRDLTPVEIGQLIQDIKELKIARIEHRKV